MSQGSLFDAAAPAPEWVDDPRMVTPTQVEAWARWVAQSPELVLDYETDGLEAIRGHRAFMVGCFAPDKGAKIVDLRLLPQALPALKDALAARTGVTIVHNAKNELSHSWALGTDIGGTLWDNQAASFAIDERRESHGQKELCRMFGVPTPMADALEAYMQATFGTKDRGHQNNPNSLEVPYNAEDVSCAWELYVRQKRQATETGVLSVVQTDSELTRPVTEMENTGVRLDMDGARALLAELQDARASAYKALCSSYGSRVDPASHTEVFGILYGHWGIPMHHDVEKVGKLDDDVLSWMLTVPDVKADARRVAFIEALRDWREYDKLIDTYLLPWLYEHQLNGVLYPHLNLTAAGTRRFTAEKPNLQNIPARSKLGKRMRQLLVSFVGCTSYSFDYSQVEYRTFAHCAGERRLIDGYRNSRKFDIHTAVAEVLNAMVAGLNLIRDDAKHLNFGILYGMGIDKLARKLGVSKDKAKAILDTYMRGIPSVQALKNKLKAEVRRKGYVTSVLGGRRHLRPEEDYKALNTLCQMTAADIIRRAMVQTYRAARHGRTHGPSPWGMKFQLQVHDELLFSLPGEYEAHGPTLKAVTTAMEDMPMFEVPMLVEGERFAPSWGQKEAA